MHYLTHNFPISHLTDTSYIFSRGSRSITNMCGNIHNSGIDAALRDTVFQYSECRWFSLCPPHLNSTTDYRRDHLAALAFLISFFSLESFFLVIWLPYFHSHNLVSAVTPTEKLLFFLRSKPMICECISLFLNTRSCLSGCDLIWI